ncbi:MAG: hypothetical protein A2W31_12885 [Planctomycetes bacterium RBG_16_64_10]|nr:MAG: hypothetical protein A2W31_12885 [Planctomycetes bacterium RBG_16_64_10]
MAYPEIQTPTTLTQVGVKVVERRRTRAALGQCLVVSTNQQRGDQFERAAADGGWQATTCRNAQTAAVVVAHLRFHLAIVDLQRSSENRLARAGLRQLAEALAAEAGLLLVLCGNDGDAVEEIWAHQLGVWLYLPGVDETCDLAMVCGEARAVVEKLNPQLAAKSKAQNSCGFMAAGG